MVCGAGYTLVLKRLTQRYSAFFLTACQAFVGSVFFAFVFLLSGGGAATPLHFELVPGLAVVYLGAFVTLGAYGLFNYSVGLIPAGKASAFLNLIPVFTIVLARTLLGESLTAIQCLASIMVLGGVLLSQKRSHRGG